MRLVSPIPYRPQAICGDFLRSPNIYARPAGFWIKGAAIFRVRRACANHGLIRIGP